MRNDKNFLITYIYKKKKKLLVIATNKGNIPAVREMIIRAEIHHVLGILKKKIINVIQCPL